MKMLTAILASFVVGVISTSLFFLSRPKEVEIKIVEKKAIEYKTIDRDYSIMPRNDIVKELYRYDMEKPRLDGKIDGNTFMAIAGLGPREWKRDFILKADISRDWRGYFIVAGVGAIAGGYAIYKLRK